MATMKPPVKQKSYPMTQDEMDAGYYQAQSELRRDEIRKAEAAQDKIDAQKRKMTAAPKPKTTPEDQMPIEARELMRQKAKDAAYKESEKERNLGNMFAKGGRVTRGDGCAQRGHTKGKNR